MFKMKNILFVVFSLLSGFAYGQVCADTDTTRSNAVSLITANTVRVNGSVSHFSGAPTSLQLRYVRVGQTDTATSSSVPTTALRNLTGLQAATQYYYYYKTICGSGSASQTIGAYTFTTLANTVLYVPERPTVFNHLKVDSSFIVPEGDTVVGREPSTRAQIRYKTSDNTFYGYYTDCTCWRALAIDSSGIIGLLDGKVDSVTVSGDSLFYWKVGVSYGYILPSVATVWHTTGNTGIDTSTDFIGTTDNVDFPIKTNDVRRFTVNTSGAWGIGQPPDYGTSGYVYKSAGSAAAPTWSAHTFQNALTAGSTLTGLNSVNGGGFEFDLLNTSVLQLGASGASSYLNLARNDGTGDKSSNIILRDSVLIEAESNSTSRSSSISVYPDMAVIKPSVGVLIIDTLTNLSTQDEILGRRNSTGQVGYITIGSGLSLSSGDLSATGTSLTSTYIGYGSAGNAVTGDANLTYTAASSAVALDSGYLSFTGHKNYGSAVNGSIFRSSLYGLTTRAVAGSSYDWLLFSAGGNTILANPTGTDNFLTSGKFGFGSLGLTPSALVNIAAGTATANTAPLKFTSGTNLTTAEAGAVEYNGSNFFMTATATNRRQVALSNVATPTSGYLLVGNGTDWTITAPGSVTGLNYISALTNGVGTTANSTAVDLGGTVGANVAIDEDGGNDNSFDIGRNTAFSDIRLGALNFTLNGGPVQMNNYGAGTATFDASGNITSVSDMRLKNLQGMYGVGLKQLMQINPIVYKYNTKSKLDTVNNYIGFSAQNVKDALGENAVGINKDGYYSLQDRALIAASINAIKELKQLNDAQQKEIDNLKKEVRKLKK